jgi:hypothetical protein
MRCLLVGTAKSGTTALFTLVRQAMDAPAAFFEEPLASLLPALQAHDGDAVAKVIFSHEADGSIARAAAAFDRRVLLTRDPRDVLVSSLLYSVANDAARLADDAFLDRYAALLRAKQAAPASVAFRDIAALFDFPEEAFIARVLRRQARFAEFVAQAGTAWHVLRYADLVTGRLASLAGYLGLSLDPNVKVAPEHARVERTRSAGDWRHWFTPDDVAALRPAIDPLLERQGIPADWAPAPAPRISPGHSWRYVDRLVDERRRHFGQPPRGSEARAAPACNLCGGIAFGPGPGGRMAITGAAPRCLGCDSLERQRTLRRVLQAFPPGFLDWRHVLQVSRDNGLPDGVFARVDAQAADGDAFLASSGAEPEVDLLVFSHFLEYVRDDLGVFAGMARRLSSRGFMLGCFAAPWARASSVIGDEAPGNGPRRLYGRDLARRFRCTEPGLTVVAVEEPDPCTGSKEVIHLFFKDADDAARACRWLRDSGARIGPEPA